MFAICVFIFNSIRTFVWKVVTLILNLSLGNGLIRVLLASLLFTFLSILALVRVFPGGFLGPQICTALTVGRWKTNQVDGSSLAYTLTAVSRCV